MNSTDAFSQELPLTEEANVWLSAGSTFAGPFRALIAVGAPGRAQIESLLESLGGEFEYLPLTESLEERLAKGGYTLYWVDRLAHALAVARARPDAVLVCSGLADASSRAAALNAGADAAFAGLTVDREAEPQLRRALARCARIAALEGEVKGLHALALTDALTQIANQRAFQERLADEFRRAQRYSDSLALLIVDADHFKRINDNHGHQVGDEVLRALALAIRQSLRETDFVARCGGEEFAALLPKTTLAGALSVAERVQQGVRAMQLPGADLSVTVSIGVSGFPGREVHSADELFRTADEALYRAKANGRDRVSLFHAPWLASGL